MTLRKNKDVLQYPQNLNFEDDDFTLIKKFAEGDESIFPDLVKRHKEKVRNIIYITLGNSGPVDDLAQDVFLTVYKNLTHFRFQSRFTTWLYRITVNKCRDHLRKMKIRSILIPIKESDADLTYNSNTENKEIREIVRNAIEKLPDKLRIPLMLKEIEGFSYQEISEFIQCEIGTVKSRIFRAREKLKDILRPYARELM